MHAFFKDINSLMKELRRPYNSSNQQINTKNLNLAVALINNTSALDLEKNVITSTHMTIPVKVVQTISCFSTLGSKEIKPLEKVFNSIEGTIALAQLVMAITLTMLDKSCASSTSTLCNGALLLRILYTGVLGTGWVSAHLTSTRSQTAYKNNQRINVGSAFLSTGIIAPTNFYAVTSENMIEPYLNIPTKIAQISSSMYSVFNKDSSAKEKTINILEAVVAFAQLGLAIGLLFAKQSCEDDINAFCKVNIILQLLYLGLITAGFAYAELGESEVITKPRAPRKQKDLEMGEVSHTSNIDQLEQEATIQNRV